MAERRLRAAFKTAMRGWGWGWAPWWLPVATVLLLGVHGGPRCPVAVSSAVGAVIQFDGRRWGPAAFLTLAGAAWQKIERWLLEMVVGHRPAVDVLAARLRGDLRAGRQVPRSSAYEA
eukprot:3513656-Alexandrium_andersonii.AAC.1